LPGLGFAYPEYLCPAGWACALRRRTLVFQDNLPRALDLDLFPTLHAVSLSHCSSSFRFLPVFTSGVLFHWVHCVHHRPQFVICQEGASTICHFFENFPMDWGKVHFHPRVCHSVARPIATTGASQSIGVTLDPRWILLPLMLRLPENSMVKLWADQHFSFVRFSFRITYQIQLTGIFLDHR
jgi:hypothetical protein